MATAVGSRFLDKKVDVNLDDETLTIGELKDMLTMRFPGGPPRSLQRLFLGSRLLRDDEPASSLREDEEEDDEHHDCCCSAAPLHKPWSCAWPPPSAVASSTRRLM